MATELASGVAPLVNGEIGEQRGTVQDQFTFYDSGHYDRWSAMASRTTARRSLLQLQHSMIAGCC
jgi:hypothetical protein